MATTGSHPLRTLGNSDLHLSPIGFGAWAIGGGDWAYAWGPQDDNQSIAAIHRALDLGINWIDTAAIYGLGHSEEVVARALKSVSQRPYVFTKCGIRWGADRAPVRTLKPASLAEEVDASLRRLNVETIDLYQIPLARARAADRRSLGNPDPLPRPGKIRWMGVSNFNVEQMKRIMKIAPITSLQPPYSMLRPAIEAEILPFVQQNGIGVINYSPMVSGLLTGKMSAERVAAMPADDWRRKGVEFNEPRLSRNLRLVELLREIGNGHSVSPAWSPWPGRCTTRRHRRNRWRAKRRTSRGAVPRPPLQAQ